MINSLLRQIMTACELTQRQLADVMGCSLDRVKGLTTGRVKKLSREESAALVRTLKIRGDWLATGEGPMFQSKNEQAFTNSLDILRAATEMATSMTRLSQPQQLTLQEIIYATVKKDVATLEKSLNNVLSQAEANLLDNYRGSSEEGKRVVEAAADAASQQDAQNE